MKKGVVFFRLWQIVTKIYVKLSSYVDGPHKMAISEQYVLIINLRKSFLIDYI